MGWASMKSLSGPAYALEPTAQQLRPLGWTNYEVALDAHELKSRSSLGEAEEGGEHDAVISSSTTRSTWISTNPRLAKHAQRTALNIS
jgi:hypothetical protein